MPRHIDLTHPIRSGMQVYPGDPQVVLSPALSVGDDGVAVTAVRLGSHSGTHIDAPSHSVAGGRTISDVGLDELSGPALTLHLEGLAAGEEIAFSMVADQVTHTVPSIVVLSTGWARLFGTEEYLDHPYLHADAAAELWDRGMRVLGVDSLSPDRSLQLESPIRLPVHDLVLGRNGLIVENLRAVDALPARCEMGFFPLSLHNADGAPVRALAWTEH